MSAAHSAASIWFGRHTHTHISLNTLQSFARQKIHEECAFAPANIRKSVCVHWQSGARAKNTTNKAVHKRHKYWGRQICQRNANIKMDGWSAPARQLRNFSHFSCGCVHIVAAPTLAVDSFTQHMHATQTTGWLMELAEFISAICAPPCGRRSFVLWFVARIIAKWSSPTGPRHAGLTDARADCSSQMDKAPPLAARVRRGRADIQCHSFQRKWFQSGMQRIPCNERPSCHVLRWKTARQHLPNELRARCAILYRILGVVS